MEALFSEIFREHECRLHSLALTVTKSRAMAEDIIQDVFTRLWEHRESLGEIRSIESWLYRLTENRIIDFLRKAAADSRLRATIWNNLEEMVDEAESRIVIKEYNAIIRQAIEGLPPQRRLIYKLNKEEGKNYQEIANQLHLSTHTVKNQLHSATRSVRELLQKNFRIFFLIIFSIG